MQCSTVQTVLTVLMVYGDVGHLAIALTNVSLLFRCSLLEPGPMGTSIDENVEDWTKKYDKPTADQKTVEL